MGIDAWRKRVRDYSEITNLGPVARRYFVIGAFDGAMTILGIVVGAYSAAPGGEVRGLIIATAVSAAVALAVSSAVGAYEAERVEKKLDMRSIERAMLTRLSEEHREAFRFAAYVSAIVHGIAPFVAALPPLIPFFLLPMEAATFTAILVTLAFLFALGAYLGSLVRERLLLTGLRFAVAGLATAGLLWFLRLGTP